jgi:hypothetical protein
MTTRPTVESLQTAAAEAFDRGFSSEAARKSALAQINRAWEMNAETIREDLLRVDHAARDDAWRAHYWSFPDYPHQWTAKAATMFAGWPAQAAKAAELAELRAAVKAAPIERLAPVEAHPRAAAAQRAMSDELARIRANVTHAVELGRIFEGLPVSASGHYCQNAGGTAWIRVDYYLAGRRTALGVILAAADRLEREAGAQ